MLFHFCIWHNTFPSFIQWDTSLFELALNSKTLRCGHAKLAEMGLKMISYPKISWYVHTYIVVILIVHAHKPRLIVFEHLGTRGCMSDASFGGYVSLIIVRFLFTGAWRRDQERGFSVIVPTQSVIDAECITLNHEDCLLSSGFHQRRVLCADKNKGLFIDLCKHCALSPSVCDPW